MTRFGRPAENPREVTRVTGLTGTGADADAVSVAVRAASSGDNAGGDEVVLPDLPPIPDLEQGATPVPTRLQRLGAVVDRARPGRNGRNVRKWLETIGMCLIVFGFVCILLGWYGAAHSPFLYQEVPYLISGGLLGVALVIGGGVLVHCAWCMRKVEEDRRNALAVVRSVDRLERIMRNLDEARRVESDAAPRRVEEEEHSS
jgi:hypothetical protein